MKLLWIALVFLTSIGSIASVASASTSASYVGSAYIYAPAVLLNNNTGTLTVINLTVSSGNGTVAITGPAHVGNSTIQSAYGAANYASAYLHMNESHYDFNYRIMDSNANVSGPSAGAAMTMLAVSALSGKPLLHNFTMTGTIMPNGSIGEIGGVYDKASAAFLHKLGFVLVPSVPAGSTEDIIYLITEENFGIPLVQVSNISQAAEFAFGYEKPAGHQTSYDFYVNYSVDSVPNATLKCSGPCYLPGFQNIQNLTLNFSNAAIGNLSSQKGFGGTAAQLYSLNNEANVVASKGYLYTSADMEFLDYVETYTFLSHSTTIPATFAALNSTGAYCSALFPPELTSTNYAYVIGGELRQSWANLTLNTTVPSNLSQIDTDTLLRMAGNIGESYAWCKASSFMYNAAQSIGGIPVSYSSSVKSLAYSRITRASAFPGFYLNSAKQLYDSGDYGAAIYAADYAYADGTAALEQNATPAALRSMAVSTADNSTYGIWGTEFANDALFYVNESLTKADNSTASYYYAYSAYQTALIANQISNDTMNIGNGLNPTTSSTTIPQSSAYTGAQYYAKVLLIAVFAIALSIISIVISLGSLVLSRGRPRPKRINRARR